MSESERQYYQHYRDLALLYVVFSLSDKEIKSISTDTVREKFLKFFPEENDFPDLLRRAEKMGSIIPGTEILTITEIGMESANRLGDPIKRMIDKQM